ncbi:unnamed protein product [Amoebophrya sp. A120]|nr:unnamed protein product [Amoebophrya sp. A120]|eukprot:GSA120T00009740001.1
MATAGRCFHRPALAVFLRTRYRAFVGWRAMYLLASSFCSAKTTPPALGWIVFYYSGLPFMKTDVLFQCWCCATLGKDLKPELRALGFSFSYVDCEGSASSCSHWCRTCPP